jgi:hypothetical protein
VANFESKPKSKRAATVEQSLPKKNRRLRKQERIAKLAKRADDRYFRKAAAGEGVVALQEGDALAASILARHSEGCGQP